jgi:hypothetical protein
MWAKYELIWSDITAQTVTLVANLLVMAQTIPQNAHQVFFFFLPKVAFTKDISILNMARVFKIWLFCNIEICENT